LRHLSLSICSTVRAFFSSCLAVRTSAAIWRCSTWRGGRGLEGTHHDVCTDTVGMTIQINKRLACTLYKVSFH
jgi:hypothetical protein